MTARAENTNVRQIRMTPTDFRKFLLGRLWLNNSVSMAVFFFKIVGLYYMTILHWRSKKLFVFVFTVASKKRIFWEKNRAFCLVLSTSIAFFLTSCAFLIKQLFVDMYRSIMCVFRSDSVKREGHIKREEGRFIWNASSRILQDTTKGRQILELLGKSREATCYSASAVSRT